MQAQLEAARAAHESKLAARGATSAPVPVAAGGGGGGGAPPPAGMMMVAGGGDVLAQILELARQQSAQLATVTARFDALEARLDEGDGDSLRWEDAPTRPAANSSGSGRASGRDSPSSPRSSSSMAERFAAKRRASVAATPGGSGSSAVVEKRMANLEAMVERLLNRGGGGGGGGGGGCGGGGGGGGGGDPAREEELETEIEELKQEMIELKMDAAEHEMEVQALEQRAVTAESALAKCRDELKGATADLESLVQQKSQLQLDNLELEDLVTSVRAEKDAAAEEIDELHFRIEQQEEEIEMISRSAQDMAQLQAAKRAAERSQPSADGLGMGTLGTPPPPALRSGVSSPAVGSTRTASRSRTTY